MTHVLALLDDTSASGPVIETAAFIAQSLGADLCGVHGQPWSADVQEQAAARGLKLELLDAPADQALLEVATQSDHALVVVGLRHDGDQVPGELVHALVAHLRVPLILVPPNAPLAREPRRILFPIDGTLRVSAAARPVVAMYVARGFEVQALHVFDPSTVPLFHDGPEDELVWRDEFVSEHFAALDVALTTRPGPLVPALLAIAEQQSTDIIALPSHPAASEDESSVLRQLLENATCPIALVPLPARTTADARVGTAEPWVSRA